jgi:hypothetical protein
MPGDYNPRVQWAALAVLLLLVGGIIIASMYSTNDAQVATNAPAVETTGAAGPTQRPPQRP